MSSTTDARRRKFFGDILAESLSSTRYTRHELEEDVLPVVAAESAEAAASPVLKALDLAHLLAFRYGLGATLYAGEHAAVSESSLRDYARTAFSKGNIAVVGQGISTAALTAVFAPHLKDVAAPTTKATVYHGGETRVAGSGPQTIFIGFGQSGTASPELEVLANYLSPTPSIKWSSGTSALAKSVPQGVSVETVLYSYSDAALFGFLVQAETAADASTAAKAAVAAVKALAGGAPGADELKSAIAKARFRAAHSVDGRTGFAAATAAQLLTGSSSLESALSAFGGVQAAAVTKVRTNNAALIFALLISVLLAGCYRAHKSQARIRRRRRCPQPPLRRRGRLVETDVEVERRGP